MTAAIRPLTVASVAVRRTPASALLARLVTGPLAFAAGGVLDWLGYILLVIRRRIGS